MISGFKMGDRVRHIEQGEGNVVLRDRENVGIRFDRQTVGCYGASFFERFPAAIVNLRPPPAPKPKTYEDGLSIEERIHVECTGHMPEEL